MSGWIWQREGGGGGAERGGVRAGEKSRVADASSAKTPLTCPPQAVDTELLYNLKSFGRQQRGGGGSV